MFELFRRFGGRIAVVAAVLLTSLCLHAQPVAATLEGVLQIVWGDPHPEHGMGGDVLYSLALSDGSTVPLTLTGQDSVAASYFGKLVTVSGAVVLGSSARRLNASAPEGLVVQSIALSTQPRARAAEAGVFGTKKVIYLLVKFSDDAAVPHPPSFYTNLNNPDVPPNSEVFPATVNGFFNKTSWNQFSWVGDVGGAGGVGASGGWLTLPHPKSYYANCGWSSSCASLQTLGDDATVLGRQQGIDFKNYDNINFVLSNDLDCCAWGGTYFSSVDSKTYGATWEPPWGQEAGTYAHEMGHSLGLPHSGWVYYAYDSPWDMMSNRMSASSVTCGSYISKNNSGTSNISCTEPGDGYIAAHKNFLGWIPSLNVVEITATAVVTVTLEGGALPLGANTKLVKICLPGYACTGSTARYFTVEARVRALGATSQYDNGIPGEGVVIHDFRGDRPSIGGVQTCFFNNQSGWALPVDSTPNDYDSTYPTCSSGGRSYPNYALFNSQWTAGQTYTNNQFCFTVTVVSRSGSNFVVAIGATNCPVSVSKSGTGTGTVTSNPVGINCGATCSASFPPSSTVTLTATPASGSYFAAWSGACSGSGTCGLTMSSAQTATATFALIAQPAAPTILSITPGPGNVTVVLGAPANTGGVPIVSYTVTCSASGQPTVSATGAGLTIVVYGLKAGVNYSCTASANNGSYASVASTGSTAIPKVLDITPILMLLLD